MSKTKNFMSIFIPTATVFISSFCIMVLELVASRLIANYLGSSLYTWTAVIGVILAGITLGNYIGGRIADTFHPRKSIAVLFAIGSATCIVTVILNNIVGRWIWLWHLSWPLHVFTHVSLVFLTPSILLGTISPVVAKMALDRGLPTGRTIGDIYAWGAAGSIAGTFATGYFMIAMMGTITIIWTIGAVLLLMSILYWFKCWPLSLWAAVFIALMTVAMVPAEWAQETASLIALREGPDPTILYEDESRYYHIAVKRAVDNPHRLFFYQDRLKHSEMLTDDILKLQYVYTRIYAVITEGLSRNKENLCAMAIGGGGYVFPRYIEKVWPGSRIDVIEIDPDVTRAAMQAFGLGKNTTINTIHMDARNYVDKLLEEKQGGREVPQYDFIYGEAFNDLSPPFQLVTREFNEKLSAILSDDGVYMINLVDIFDSGLFLGSVINTLKKTFPYVYTVTGGNISHSSRSAFVIVAGKHKIDLEKIISEYEGGELELWYLDDSDLSHLRQKSHSLILTDDYSPVENLLIPVIRDNARDISSEKYLEHAEELQQKGRFSESVKSYLSAIKTYPVVSVRSYNEVGILYDRMGNLEHAVDAFNKAIQYNNESGHKMGTANIRHNLGIVLKKLGKSELAMEEFQKAVEELRRDLTHHPDLDNHRHALGLNFNAMGDFEEAAESFKKALALNPDNPVYHDHLVAVLEQDGRYGEAIQVMKKYIQLMKNSKRDEEASQLQRYLESLENKLKE
ncbi:MAG: fused MFS/spermidine synthase [Desulfobacterales bacterium]|nr:fused MFS/spermidine synthase [Desulfobacterales bacterium]